MIVCSAVRAAAWVVAIAALFVVAPDAATSFLNAQMTTTWTFDRLENIGGHRTTVLGEPRVIDAPVGKAVEFDGKDDALFIENHPLAGAEAFTWEAIFRPDGGEKEQRWFHLNEQDPVTGADTENRMLFEIRVVDDKWFLDSYNQSGAANKALINRMALHPLGAWYHVAAVYDGKEFSNYVDGVREGAAELHLRRSGSGPYLGWCADQQSVLFQGSRAPGAIHAQSALSS